MVSSDDFDDKATNLNGFYLHINFEQKSPKPAIVILRNLAKKWQIWNSMHFYNRKTTIQFYDFLSWLQTIFSLKFSFSKKVTKFETISHMIWRLHHVGDSFKFLWPFQNVWTLKGAFGLFFVNCMCNSEIFEVKSVLIFISFNFWLVLAILPDCAAPQQSLAKKKTPCKEAVF